MWEALTILALKLLTDCASAAAAAVVVFGALIYYQGCVTLLRQSVREHMAGEIKIITMVTTGCGPSQGMLGESHTDANSLSGTHT